MNEKAPDAFRTISEVADWLGVNAHVLRFWESKFSQVKPVKRAGGRRYYRPADMELLGGIQRLLHEDGMTIKGVQKVLREQGIRAVAKLSKPVNGDAVDALAEVPDDESADSVAPDGGQLASASFSLVASNRPQRKAPPAAPPPKPAAAPPATQASPEPDTPPEPSPAAAMPLFAHGAPESGVATAAPSAAESEAPVATASRKGPVIAPLPGPELSLDQALARIPSYRVDAAALRPIYEAMCALRDRMDAGA